MYNIIYSIQSRHCRKVLAMDWGNILTIILGSVFGTGGAGSLYVANQKIKHNKEINNVQVNKLRSEFEAGIAQMHNQLLQNLREDVARADKRNDELTLLLHTANQRIAKLELCLIANNIQLPQ